MQGSMGAQRAPEADEGLEQAVRPPLELVVARDDGDDLGGGEGTTRRAMVTKGVLLIAGAFGAGIAATPARVIGVLAPVYLAGILLGTRLNKRAPEEVVRRAVLLLVVVIATAGLML